MTHFAAILLIVLSQLMDYVSTIYALEHGAEELNPVVRWLGVIPTKILVAILGSVVVLFLTAKWAFLVGFIWLIVSLIISAWNISQASEHAHHP